MVEQLQQAGGRHRKKHHRRRQHGGEPVTYTLDSIQDGNMQFKKSDGTILQQIDNHYNILNNFINTSSGTNNYKVIGTTFTVDDGGNVTIYDVKPSPASTEPADVPSTTATGGMPTKVRIGSKTYQLYVKMGGEYVTVKRAMAIAKKKAASKKK